MSKFAAYEPEGTTTPVGAILTRPAVADDCPALALIAAEREEGTVAHFERAFRALMASHREYMLVATVGGTVAGYGKCAYLDHPDAPGDMPSGWYLTGIIVAPAWRRHGVGRALTRARLDWLADRTSTVYYFASSENRVSLALHAGFGFVEMARGLRAPGVTISRGVSVLHQLDLTCGERS